MTPAFARVCVVDFGINRIMVGHQPHGDAPTTINYSLSPDPSDITNTANNGSSNASAASAPEGKSDSDSEGGGNHSYAPQKRGPFLQVIMGDTSYSANTLWNFDQGMVYSDNWQVCDW